MAKQVVNTFAITIKGQPDAYTIEADGPKGIRVDPQPFTLSPTPEQKATIVALANEKARVSSDAVIELGRALHDAVFTPPIATAFGRAQGGAGADRGVRLRLQVEAPELAFLPWEAMHDGQGFLSAKSDCPLVRTLPERDAIQPIKRLQVRGALRILLVGASPQGLPALEVEQTATQLRQLLGEATRKKRIVFDVLTDATLDELRSKLLQNYHILYFAGHGTPAGMYLDDGMGGERDPRSGKRPAGDKYLVTAQTLAQELEGKPTRLVFLAACKTGASLDEESGLLVGFAQELARLANLPAIVAMQYPITDIQANQLTARFFESLAAFYPVDIALAEARKSLIRGGQVGRDVIAPVMYLQAEDGALFQRARNWVALGLSAALFISITVLCIAVTLGSGTIFLLGQKRQHAQSTAEAEATKRSVAEATTQAETAIARSRELAAQSIRQLNTNYELALLLAIEGGRKADTFEADDALHHSFVHPGRTLSIAFGHTAGLFQAEWNSDGKRIVTASSDGTARVWDAESGAEFVVLEGHSGGVSDTRWDRDGERIVTASLDGTARVWDAQSGVELVRLVGHTLGVDYVAWNEDGTHIVTASFDGTARVWDAQRQAAGCLDWAQF